MVATESRRSSSRASVQREKEKKLPSDEISKKKDLIKKKSPKENDKTDSVCTGKSTSNNKLNSRGQKNDTKPSSDDKRSSSMDKNSKDSSEKKRNSTPTVSQKRALNDKSKKEKTNKKAESHSLKNSRSHSTESPHYSNKSKSHKEKINHTKNSSKLKHTTELDDYNDVDFSKIENMIFDNPVEKSTKNHGASKKQKEKEGKDTKSRNNKKDEKKSTSSKSDSKQRRTSSSKKLESSSKKGKSKSKLDSDSDESDWEEVDDGFEEINELEALLADTKDDQIAPKESVQIELDAPDVVWGMKKRKKRRTEQEMIEEYLRKHVNRSIKEVYENMHKSHLLCLFAHHQYINKTLNSDILLGSALSIITNKEAYPPKRLDMGYLEKFVNWFSRKVTVQSRNLEDDYWDSPLENMLAKRFEKKVAYCNRELVYMFVVVCRALGMNVRLVVSLQPMSWKPSAGALIKRLKEENKSEGIETTKASSSKAPDIKMEIKSEPIKPKVKNNRKMLSSDSDLENVSTKTNKKNKNRDSSASSSTPNKRKRTPSLSDDDDDLDFELGTKYKRGPKKSTISKKRESSGSSEGGKKRKSTGKTETNEGKKKKSEPLIEWAEIYVEEEEKWMCVDIIKAKIHCIPEIEARTPSSSAYITAFNADLTVKDITRRYIASWLSNENKLRCCTKWWGKALRSFRGRKTRLDKEEDEEMDQNLRQQPMPKVIGEYKNHPLYALQRHLLKFEAIYPPDETPVGYIKGEPVFPRSSVYTCHSRDTWMKEAKTVRVDEEPYKVVKARPKWDRNTCQVIKDRPLDIFGEWQVEDFEPPVASGGKVPRSEYGSVELFKPTMLPRGCVHIPIAGLNRIAKKLNIDCAPAMTGFDYHSGWSHPVYEGFVVCEEFHEVLMDAWNQDQVEQAKRAEEKREKRIYDNWKKLIRGLLVRERVREKYGTEVPSDEELDEQEEDDKSKIKQKGKAGKKTEQKKPKITQSDIDAARPVITHTVQNLKIDLTSNVVDMAKASRKSTMKTSNNVTPKVRKSKEQRANMSTSKDGNLDNSSDEETDEEGKRQKIRAILNWGTGAVNRNPDLSDDSDNEGSSIPSCSKSIASTILENSSSTLLTLMEKKKKKIRNTNFIKSADSESSSKDSSRSTTPEPIVGDFQETVPRKRMQRSARKKPVKYEESDDGEGDISLGESDVEDKSFNPLKTQIPDTLDLSESD